MGSRYLLDTHIFLWWLEDSQKLEKNLYNIISNTKNSIYISSASIWEISIKISLGKLQVDANLDSIIDSCGFDELKITAKHANLIKDLPHIHKDPFDRMLTAQAMYENMVLISDDGFIKMYDDVKVLC